MRRLGLLIVASGLAACSGSDAETPKTGIDAELVYDSTLDLETFEFALLNDASEVRVMEQLPVPVTVGPSGQRRVNIIWELDSSGLGPGVLWIRGADVNGLTVAEGQSPVVVEDGQLAEVTIELGPPARCGDGVRLGSEGCDDGNQRNLDGCDAACVVEPGYTCTGSPSRCVACGNGIPEEGEECDDNNLIDGDGCSSTCTLEPAPQLTMFESEALDYQTIEPGMSQSILHLEVPQGLGGQTLVLATGRFSATAEAEDAAVAEVMLVVNGDEADHAGHQTRVNNADGAGFVLVTVLPEGTGTASISVAGSGEGSYGMRVSMVRLVAWQLPPGAPVAVSTANTLEDTGIDLELARLEWEVTTPGDWLVIAKANASELPNTSTVRTRFVSSFGPDSRVWSNGREPRAPAVFISTETFDAGRHEATLLGTSSGGYADVGWFDDRLKRRHQIDFSEAAMLQGDRTVPIVFDHASMVADGFSRPDGSDVHFRVRYEDGRWDNLPVYVGNGWNKGNTRVWFRTGTQRSQITNVVMYFHNPDGSMVGERAPPTDVFRFYDGFDNGDADSALWQGTGLQTPGNGQLLLQEGSQVQLQSVPTFNGSLRVETLATITNVENYGGQLLGLFYSPAGQIAAEFAFGGNEGGLFATISGTATPLDASVAMGPHLFAIDTSQNGMMTNDAVFYVDGAEVLSGTGNAVTPDRKIGIEHRTGEIALDFVRAYRPVPSGAVATLLEVEGLGGLEASTWTWPTIIAIPLSAAQVTSAIGDAEVVSTSDVDLLPMASLTAPARETGQRLVLGGLRVAGDSNVTNRKVGYITANRENIMLTEHVLDRDASFVNGYHHPAFVADVRSATTAVELSAGISSPDGITVEGSDAVLMTFDVP